MNSENKIGQRETLTLLIVVISAKIFLSLPRNLAQIAAGAGWMITLLAGLNALIGFIFIYGIAKRYPSLTIVEAGRKICGPFIGTVIGSVFFVFFLCLTSLLLRQFAESFILAILPSTPISVILLFFLILLAYSVFLGIETLARIAWAIGPYLLTALAAILVFTIPEMKLTFLLPVFGKGIGPIFQGSLMHGSIYAEILLFGFLTPLLRKKENLFKVGLFGLLISILICLVIEIFVLTIFNYVAATRMTFPIFQLTRLISIGEFVQRVEAVFVFLWFFTACIQLGGLFYGTLISFSEAFHIEEHKPLIIPLGLLVFCISLLPTSMTEAVDINDFRLSGFYTAIAFGIPAIVWLIAFLTKKKAGDAQ